jgi:hypothetical protein
MVQAEQDLSRAHFARLREFRKFSGNRGIGLMLHSPQDKYLAERGFLTQGPHLGLWVVSDQGLSALEARESFEAERRRPHNDFAIRVARWLEHQGRRAWLNRSFEVSTRNDLRAVKHLDLMPRLAQPGTGFVGPLRYISRPDVISILPNTHRQNYEPWIFEVKVSRRDFFVDVEKPQKRLAYALLAERIYYACPRDLITIDEVPPGCGLVVEVRKGVFEVIAEAPRCKIRHSAHVNRLLRFP